MRTPLPFLVALIGGFCFAQCLIADDAIDQRWSPVTVRVFDELRRQPIAGARIQQMCTACRYGGQISETDTNGTARVMTYDTWVALRVTREGFSNVTIQIYSGDTNSVSLFRSNAVITMRRITK
jgi:hypothetical protein